MQTSGYRLSRIALLALAICLLATSFLRADETHPVENQATSSAKVAPEDGRPNSKSPGSEKPVTEEPPLIFAPDKEGRLVPLLGFSYEEIAEFLQTKKNANQKLTANNGYDLQQLVLSGSVRDDVAEFTAQYQVRLQSDRSIEIPLLGDGPVLREPEEYRGQGEHALRFDANTKSYSIQLKGAANSKHEINLKFAVPLKRVGTQCRLEMTLPSAAASSLKLRVPGGPIALVSNSGAAVAESKPLGQNEAEIGLLGLGGPLALAWDTADSGKARSVSLESSGQISAQIDSRSVQFDCVFSVRSLGKEFDQFHLKLPNGVELAGNNRVTENYSLIVDSSNSRLVEVRLPKKTIGPIDIHISAERAYDVTKPNIMLELAGFEVVESAPHRQFGQIAVAVQGDWQITWGGRNRVRQIEELAKPLQGADVIAGFEYFGQPAVLSVGIAPKKTRILVQPEYLFFVDAHQLRMEARIKYTIHGAKASSLEIAMPEWEIDEILPTEIVDVDATVGLAGPTTRIPLRQLTAGDFDLTVRAHRRLPGNSSRIEIQLPAPTADSTGPAIVALLPANNVRIRPRETESQGLSRPAIAPRIQLPPHEQPAIFYRAEQASGTFVADLERLPQTVSAGVESTVSLGRTEILVKQVYRYRVEHESLQSITIDVPKNILSDGNLEFSLDGQPLTSAPPGEIPNDNEVVGIDVPLPAPRLGTFDLHVSYRLAAAASVGEPGSLLTVPLVMPASVALQGNELTVTGDAANRVQPHDELWTIVDDVPETKVENSSSWARLSASQSTSDIALTFTQRSGKTASTTLLHRTWLQTWVSHGAWQERIAFAFSTSADEIEVALPLGRSSKEVEFRLNGETITPKVSNQKSVTLTIPARSQSHVLEMRYLTDGNLAFGKIDAQIPRIAGASESSRTYWQLILPSDMHLTNWARELTPEFTWQRATVVWVRTPTREQSELEDWIAASHADALPDATNRYLFSFNGNLKSLSAGTIARWKIVLLASSIVLIGGLLVMYVPLVRKPGSLLVIAVLAAAIAIWQPDAAVMLVQAAVLGGILLLLGNLLRYSVRKRRAAGVLMPNPSSSVSDRSGSQVRPHNVELLGAASTASLPEQFEPSSSGHAGG